MNEDRIHDDMTRQAALARYDILDTLPEEAFERLARLAATLFEAPFAFVNFIADDVVFTKASYGLDLTRTDLARSVCKATVEQQGVLVIPDLAAHDEFAAFARGNRFYAGAPITTPDGYRIGTVCVLDRAARHEITDAQRTSLSHLADIAMTELELRRATLHAQRETAAKEVLVRSLRDSQLVSETLLAVSNLVQLDLPPRDLVAHTMTLVTHVVDVDWCLLAVLRDENVTFEPVWSRDEFSTTFHEVIVPRHHDHHEQGLTFIANERDVYYVTEYEHTPRAHPALIAAGLKDIACLPIGPHDHARHVVLVGRLQRSRRWTERDKRLLDATTRSMQHAMDTQERHRVSREASITDVLTHLGNRRALELAVRAVTSDSTFSVAVLDLDKLKVVNDTRGHAAGDALLRVFASTLTADLPEGMSAYRVGGDEFVLLLVHAPARTHHEVSSRVRAQVNRAVAAMRASGFEGVEVSFGVASSPTDGEVFHEVLQCANVRLNDEKHTRKPGRKERRADEAHPLPAFPVEDVVVIGDVLLDVTSSQLQVGVARSTLSPAERTVLLQLARAAPQVVDRETLLQVLGTSDRSANVLNVHVSNLRRKLADVRSRLVIQAVRGRGFVLLPDEAGPST